MKSRIQHAVNKALAITLAAAIIGTGAVAISLTHVYASVTVTFGTAPIIEAEMNKVKVSQLEPNMRASIKLPIKGN